MKPGQGRARACFAAVFLVFAVGTCWGQDATPEEEYKKLIHVNEDIQPLGEHPFGENISLYDGALSFEQVDVSASGTGPLLQIVRRFGLEGQAANLERSQYAFGDWDLDLPRIETLVAHGWYYDSVTQQNQEVTGWEVNVASGGDANARCSQFARPPTMVTNLSGSSVALEPSTWWKGYHLVIPGQGSQDLLTNIDSASKSSYPAVTKDHWRISCVASTQNGMPGEGFLAHAPDGTTYRFDELVYRDTQDLSLPLEGVVARAAPSGTWPRYFGSRDVVADAIALLTGSTIAHAAPVANVVSRQMARMLVTQITDRFGNTVNFFYDGAGRLTSISASDGRALTIQYLSDSPLIQSVTLQPDSGSSRTWVYSYGATSPSLTTLTGVTLPDGSRWSYDLSAFDTTTLSTSGSFSSCITLASPGSEPVTGTITHPSGLIGAFTVEAKKHGRSQVPRGCSGMQYNDEDSAGSYANIPNAWYSFTLTKETLSGAGIPTRNWTYQYSPANESWSDCTSNCPTTVYTDVIDPDGSTTRDTFSNKFDATESQLLRTDYYAGAVEASALLRSETRSYASPDTVPLPAQAGGELQSNTNYKQATQYSPLNGRVITQAGDTYTWQAEAFNSYVQVTQTKRSNSISQRAIEEQTTYLNDPQHWVLGLPLETKNLTEGEVVDHYDYDLTNVTLAKRSHFGQMLMSYSFDAQGQLTSFTDGNDHTTTLDSYKHGIPQAISYPDGTNQSLVVDDLGQIQSVTDQAGVTTSYDYDSVGRLTRISYPSGDEQAWYARTFDYAFVASAERGMGGNHWRRTVAKGNQREVTYFDAGLRPVLTDTFICFDATTGSSCGASGSHSNVRADYDDKGLTTFRSYPTGGTPDLVGLGTGIHSTYDAIGRLTRTQQDSELGTLTSSIAYLSGARKQVTDPNNHVTTTAYQVFDTPSYDAVIEVEAPLGLTQTILRDLYGNPLSITQAGAYGTGTVSETKTLAYDSYHRLCRTTEPESGSELMAYDGANNLAWSAAGQTITGGGCGLEQVAGGQTVRSYDAMNRVRSVAYPAGTDSAAYTYTPTGAIKTATSGLASWTYAYNALGQLTSESLDIEGYHWPIRYDHDRYGSVATITYPDGKQVAYAPDPLGRPTKAGAYATDVAYFPNGSVQYYRSANGTEYMAEQNTRQILGSLNYFHGAVAPVIAQQYTYDPNGNLTGVDDQVDSRRDKTYGYDALNRLTSAQALNLWGMETYAYDPLNNLREIDSDGLTRAYTYNGRYQLAAINNGIGGSLLHSFVYDAQGNVTQKDGTSLLFDKANRLNQVVGGSQYAYDASGRRVKKTDASGNAVYYAYASDGRLLYQFDAATSAITDYVYLGRNLMAEVRHTEGDLILSPPASIHFDTNPNDGTYTVIWDAVGTASYELEESADGGANWLNVYSGTTTSKVVSGKAGGSYLYRVRACQEECSDWRESVALGVWPALATVSVPAGFQSGSFTVTWSRPSSAVRFDVEEQKDGGAWTRIATDMLGTSLSRTNLAAGSYVYRVSAKSDLGSRGWATSGAVTVFYPPTSAPSLSVPSVSASSSYTVSWGAVTGVDRYQLQEQYGGGDWSVRYDGASRSTVITGAVNGAHYGYQVRACNAAGCGPFSAVDTVAIAIPPSAPTGVYANDLWVNDKLETLTVVWEGVSGATAYEVEDVDTGIVVTSTAGTSAEVERGYLEPLSLHSYAVRACNAYACGGWVNASYRKIYNPPPSAPSLSVPATSTGSFTVSWGTVFQATSYTLHQRTNDGAWSWVYSGSDTSKARSSTTNGARYGYRIRACNSAGCGIWSATKTVTIAIPPPAPTAVYANDLWINTKLETMTVVWHAASGATYYEVKNVSTGTVKSVSGTSIEMGRGYNGSPLPRSYTVRACNAYACSGWVSAQYRLVYNPPSSGPVLSAPANSTGSYTVSWSSVYQASSYTLQESANGATWRTVYTGTGKSKAFSHAAGSYRYRGRASNSGGIGPWSTTKMVTVATVGTVTGLGAYVQYVYPSLMASPSQVQQQSAPSEPTAQTDPVEQVDPTEQVEPVQPADQLDPSQSEPLESTESSQQPEQSQPDPLQPEPRALEQPAQEQLQVEAQMAPPPPDGDEGWYLSVHWNSAFGATRYEVQINGGSTRSVTTTGLKTPVDTASQSIKVRACNSSTCSAWAGPVNAVIM